MEVRDELVEFSWNTSTGKEDLGQLQCHNIICPAKINSLKVLKLGKDIHMSEAIDSYDWKVL